LCPNSSFERHELLIILDHFTFLLPVLVCIFFPINQTVQFPKILLVNGIVDSKFEADCGKVFRVESVFRDVGFDCSLLIKVLSSVDTSLWASV
jgi:hypothetical protein